MVIEAVMEGDEDNVALEDNVAEKDFVLEEVPVGENVLEEEGEDDAEDDSEGNERLGSSINTS